jgi:hypothetical protein
VVVVAKPWAVAIGKGREGGLDRGAHGSMDAGGSVVGLGGGGGGGKRRAAVGRRAEQNRRRRPRMGRSVGYTVFFCYPLRACE